jgi:hypothetical protein
VGAAVDAMPEEERTKEIKPMKPTVSGTAAGG